MSKKVEAINNSEIEIKQINGLETIPIRHIVLRKGKPIETCTFPEDNLNSSFHFGLYYQKK